MKTHQREYQIFLIVRLASRGTETDWRNFRAFGNYRVFWETYRFHRKPIDYVCRLEVRFRRYIDGYSYKDSDVIR